MADVDGQTLLMAVQAVQAQMQALEARIAQAGDDVGNQEDLPMGYTQAAEALRRAHGAEASTSSNLPPHDMLLPSRE